MAMVLTRKPAKKIVFPPKNSVMEQFSYATWGAWKQGKPWNWESIANRYGIKVWDLIMFNFQCRNPEEVNWCMQEFLRCTKSYDGWNFSFDPSDKNPTIYIPLSGYQAITKEDEAARDLVMSTLKRPELKSINFRAGWGLSVTPGMLQKVLRHVTTQTILCAGRIPEKLKDEIPKSARAMYRGADNTIWVRRPADLSWGNRAAIVHEAVHAGFDVEQQGGLQWDGECCSYIAEAIFEILALNIDVFSLDPFDFVQRVGLALRAHQRWAYSIAKEIVIDSLSTPDVQWEILAGNPAYLALRNAIAVNRIYRRTYFKPQSSDGV
jgi:hypothetical protein